MQSLLYLPGSNGVANASQMTVQAVRAPGAVTNTVNTVAGVPTYFYGSMGAPHTFTDPVTGETITIISEATAVDAAFTINAGKIDIVAIAPGYTDSRGSLVGDIIVVRPITEWANNLFNLFGAAHNTDGTLKTTSLDAFYKPSEMIFDFVVPGTGVITGLGYGSTLTASISAITFYVNGLRNTIPALASRAFTANKDTYVDVLFSSTGVGTLVYTEVANNTISPALAANSIRIGIVVTGTTIVNIGSINQGEEYKLLPLVASCYYTVCDGLGNLICPRDPNRKILGYRPIASNFATASTSQTYVPGLSCPVIPPVGRKLKATLNARDVYNASVAYAIVRVWEGASAGTLTNGVGDGQAYGNNIGQYVRAEGIRTPATQPIFYNGGLSTNAGTASLEIPCYLLIELE